jgi:hypothetical protein
VLAGGGAQGGGRGAAGAETQAGFGGGTYAYTLAALLSAVAKLIAAARGGREAPPAAARYGFAAVDIDSLRSVPVSYFTKKTSASLAPTERRHTECRSSLRGELLYEISHGGGTLRGTQVLFSVARTRLHTTLALSLPFSRGAPP